MKDSDITDEQANEQMGRYAGKVNEEKVNEMLGNEEKMKGFFSHVEALKKYWNDVCDIFSLLKDRATGDYTETPWKTIAALVGALLYVLSPLDLIPDFIPVVGYLDDAAVFGFAIDFAADDLTRYRAWKKHRSGSSVT